jgi:hypothetical protein
VTVVVSSGVTGSGVDGTQRRPRWGRVRRARRTECAVRGRPGWGTHGEGEAGAGTARRTRPPSHQ